MDVIINCDITQGDADRQNTDGLDDLAIGCLRVFIRWEEVLRKLAHFVQQMKTSDADVSSGIRQCFHRGSLICLYMYAYFRRSLYRRRSDDRRGPGSSS